MHDMFEPQMNIFRGDQILEENLQLIKYQRRKALKQFKLKFTDMNNYLTESCQLVMVRSMRLQHTI
jgi:hypothetical protein